MVFEQVNCPACAESYSRVTGDKLTQLCYMCRSDFGCSTIAQVEEILEWIKDIKPEERVLLTMGRNARHHHRGHGGWNGDFKPVGTVPTRPVVDKDKVAAGIRLMTAYGLTMPLAEPLSMPTNYVLAQNGLFEVRHSDVADIYLHLSPANTEVLGIVGKLASGVQLNVPKVPFVMLAQTVAFFRGVMKRFNNAEAIVRIWWNTVDNRYEIRVPDGGQRVSGARVDHNDDFDLNGERDAAGHIKYLHVMDIHSHNNMGGFWSGTDDADERKAPEGRMFGVLGKANQTIPDWKWRMRSREGFIDLTVRDIFEIPELKIDFTAAMSLSELMIAPTITANMTCGHDPFADAECPEEWYKTVNQPTSVVHTGFQGMRGKWHDRHMGASERGTGSTTVIMPTYIFVEMEASGGGKFLEELEVMDGKTKPTGVRYTIIDGTISST